MMLGWATPDLRCLDTVILREDHLPSGWTRHPIQPTSALVAWLNEVGVSLTRIDLEAGHWRNGLMRRCGRLGSPWSFWRRGTCRNHSKTLPVKTDRNDATGDCRTDTAGLVPAGALAANALPDAVVHRGDRDAQPQEMERLLRVANSRH
jgi:hypothetical protein